MATLGSLTVSLRADSATFASDLGRAVTMAEASLGQIARSAQRVSNTLGGLGASLSAYGLVTFAAGVVRAAAELEDLHAQTGLSVTALSALQNEAAKSGIPINDVASAFDRLQKNAMAAVAGNIAMTNNFNAVGISTRQLGAALKDPQTLLLLIANAMEKFNDNGLKTGEMMTLMGRSGAQYIELLHDIARDGLAAARTTDAQAAAAKRLEVQWAGMITSIRSSTLQPILEIIAGTRLVAVTLSVEMAKAWEEIRFGAALDVQYLEDLWTGFGTFMESLAAKVAGWFNLPFEKLNQVTGGSTIASLTKEHDGIMAALNAQQEVAAAAYVNATAAPVALAGGPGKNIVPPPQKDAMAGMTKLLDSQLKALNEFIKEQDSLMKTGNMQLDADYGSALLSLAEYSTQKAALLEANFGVAQKAYSDELALAIAFAQKQTDRNLRGEAWNRVQEIADAKLIDTNKHNQDAIALNDKMIQQSKDMAKSITDVGIAYAQMTGNTEKAAALQIELENSMLKTPLTDPTAKAQQGAINQQKMLDASRNGLDGMTRALKAYQIGLADVASSTASMTTKMLGSMEDALTTFVTMGKLNWRSLIDSMIADIARLIIRQQAMGPLSSLFGGAMSTLFGGTGSTGGVDYNAGVNLIGPPMASGGQVDAGTAYMVGERGPEMFRPNQSGSIIPHGAQIGGGGILYAPTIQVDARSDRAQVQAEVAQAVRQGQTDIIALLRRYNPGLKV